MAERERRVGPGPRPGAVADVDALGVLEPALHGPGVQHRDVGLAGRPGGGQPPARLGPAQQHVGQGVAELLAGEPAQQDRRDLVAPGQLDRAAGVDHHHRAAGWRRRRPGPGRPGGRAGPARSGRSPRSRSPRWCRRPPRRRRPRRPGPPPRRSSSSSGGAGSSTARVTETAVAPGSSRRTTVRSTSSPLASTIRPPRSGAASRPAASPGPGRISSSTRTASPAVSRNWPVPATPIPCSPSTRARSRAVTSTAGRPGHDLPPHPDQLAGQPVLGMQHRPVPVQEPDPHPRLPGPRVGHLPGAHRLQPPPDPGPPPVHHLDPGPSAARSPSTGDTTTAGNTVALPPP